MIDYDYHTIIGVREEYLQLFNSIQKKNDYYQMGIVN